MKEIFQNEIHLNGAGNLVSLFLKFLENLHISSLYKVSKVLTQSFSVKPFHNIVGQTENFS